MTRAATVPDAPRAPRRPAALEASRSRIRLAIYLVTLLVALWGMHVLLQGVDWWLTCAAFAILPTLAFSVTRRFGGRGWLTVLVGIAAPVIGLTATFAPSHAILGVLPTPGTIGDFGALVAEAQVSISTQAAPALATEGIRFLLAVLAIVATMFFVPALDRLPATAALPLLVVLDIPLATRGTTVEPAWYVLTVIGFLCLLRVGRRRLRPPTVMLTGALVIVGSLLLPGLFPPTDTTARPVSGGVGNGVNPIINLGEDLRRATAVTALTYTTTASGGLYLRLATLDQFNGISWEPQTPTGIGFDVAEFPAPPGLAAEVPRATYTADIAVADVSGRWLPLPYPSVSVTGLEGTWNWERDGLAARSTGADAKGQEYEVTFLDVEPDLAQLTSSAEPDVADRFLDLPDQMPAIITDTAAEVTAGAASTYERAIALQSYFTDTDFRYSLDAPVDGGYDGTGIGVIAQFLEVKEGYCVHYASAMAVMARTLGIPARVVVGFQPGEGERDPGTGAVTYSVSSDDLHAWPELYFEGIGWLRFEPTPGRGSLPSYSFVDAVDDPATDEFEGANPTAAPSSAAEPTQGPDVPSDEETGAAGAVPVAQNPLPVLLLVAGGVLMVLLIPAAIRVIVRARRMARVRTGRDPAAAWAEIRDTAHDHDWVAPESETPRQLGTRLAVVVGAEVVDRLQGGVESAAYDRPGSPVMTVDDVADVRRAIADAAAFGVRLRAVFLPPSLVARAGFTRGASRDD